MKNGWPGLFRKALTPLALFLLVFSSTVPHAAPPVVDDVGFASVFNGQDLKGWTLQAHAWNRLAVTCEDNHIVVYLNGLKVVDAKEKGSKKGRIGMQVPKGAEFARQEVRFRNIRVKELTPKKAGAEMLLNGHFADGTNHWVVMESGATGRAEIVAEGPEGKAALRLRVLTIGDNPWRLQIYQTGMRVEKARCTKAWMSTA